MRKAGMFIALGFLILVGVAIGAWLIVFPTPRFPEPTGIYRIGTRIYRWTDTARPEPFTAEPGDRRELIAQVWYPAASVEGDPEPYMDTPAALAVLAKMFGVPAFLLSNVANAPTHAFRDAPAADGRFPVLINPPGLTAFRDASLFWIEELVSQGYVVIGLDQPGTAAAAVLSDGRVVEVFGKPAFDRYMPLALSHAEDQAPTLNGVALPGGIIPFLAVDVRFALTEAERLDRDDPILAGHLDTAHAGAFGMSLGGYSSAEACHGDLRFKACLAVDAGKTAVVAAEGLAQPLMIIGREAASMREERSKAGGWPEEEIAHTNDSQRAMYEHNRADAYYVTMDGMYHINWTDGPIWTPMVRWLGLAGPIDPYEGFARTNAYTLAFFDRYLKMIPAPLLDDLPGSKQGVRLEARHVPAGP